MDLWPELNGEGGIRTSDLRIMGCKDQNVSCFHISNLLHQTDLRNPLCLPIQVLLTVCQLVGVQPDVQFRRLRRHLCKALGPSLGLRFRRTLLDFCDWRLAGRCVTLLAAAKAFADEVMERT
jgi:hypothetical protein